MHTDLQLSEKARGYPASEIRRVFDHVSRLENVTSLTVGEPDFPTPPHVVEAGLRSIRDGETRYTPNAGIPAFRQAVARYYAKRWGRHLDERNVMVTVGGQEALILAMLVTLDPGDELLVPTPAYPNYLGQARLVGAKAVPVPLDPANGFHLRADDLEPFITPRTRAIVINSPSNPLGVVVSEVELRRLAELAERHNLVVISDEVYDHITYDGRRATSMGALDEAFDRFIVLNSLSKSFAMTGWRTGFAIAPAPIVDAMPRLQEGLVSCTPAFVQRAGIAALEGPTEVVTDMVAAYQRRRDLVVDGLRAIPGVDCAVPEGAFYAFADLRQVDTSSVDFAVGLLEQQKVAIIPGTAFGAPGEGFARLSFATDEATIASALRGITSFVAGRPSRYAE